MLKFNGIELKRIILIDPGTFFVGPKIYLRWCQGYYSPVSARHRIYFGGTENILSVTKRSEA